MRIALQRVEGQRGKSVSSAGSLPSPVFHGNDRFRISRYDHFSSAVDIEPGRAKLYQI